MILGWSGERAGQPWLWGVTGEQLREAVADRRRVLQALQAQVYRDPAPTAQVLPDRGWPDGGHPGQILPDGADPEPVARGPRPLRSRPLTSVLPPSEAPLRLVLCARDPLDFWANFWAATTVPSVLFLASPDWQSQEWRQVFALAQPHGILGEEGGRWGDLLGNGLGNGLGSVMDTSRVGNVDPTNDLGNVMDKSRVGNVDPTNDLGNVMDKSRVGNVDPTVDGLAVDGLAVNLPWGLAPDRQPPDRPPLQAGWILISTGGSSGQLRFVVHTLATLGAAVAGLQRSALIPPPGQIHSFCTLPFHHVSGLMQGLRSWGTGGQLITLPFKTLEQTLAHAPQDLAAYPLDRLPFCLSFVPTQLQRLLDLPAAPPWLARFALIFLGGAPPWPSLLDRARTLGLPLAPTYGMTETAAMVTTLAPADFLQGCSGCGPALPHVRLWVGSGCGEPEGRGAGAIGTEAGRTGEIETEAIGTEAMDTGAIGTEKIGPIHIQTPALGLGYYWLQPNPSLQPIAAGSPWVQGQDCFAPDDLGRLDGRGHLEIVGRGSDKMITGGENVFPAEVEAVIWASGEVADVAVVGRPDPVWGEVVVAVYVPLPGEIQGDRRPQPVGDRPPSLEHRLQHWVRQRLAPYKCPKIWLPIAQLPRNAQGKIDRRALRAWIPAAAPIADPMSQTDRRKQ